MSINDCNVIELPKISDPRGNLTFIEGLQHIPFDVTRVFYVYDVPTDAARGAHAHKTLHQFLICLTGSLDILLDDGFKKTSIHLNKPWCGLHIPPLIWASEANFASGTVYLVLASDAYNEKDYYRDYQEFIAAIKRGG